MVVKCLRSAMAAAALLTITHTACKAETCTGVADLAGPGCYKGSSGSLGMTETVRVNIKSFTDGKGKADFVTSGTRRVSCLDRDFSKEGQAVKVDVEGCLPSGDTLDSVSYCSDTDSLEVTLKDTIFPVPLTVSLSKVECPSNEAGSCTGAADPTGPGCYQGSAGALGVIETVKVNVKSIAAGKGTADFVASGPKAVSCLDRPFQKAGQVVTVDTTGCLPAGVTLSSVAYCSDSDSLRVTVKDSLVPVPIEATLSKVACPADAKIVI